MRKTLQPLIFLTTCVLATSAYAAVSTDEAKQLGASLTSIGAEKAGNKDGTIPEYSTQRLKAPANFDPAKPGQLPSPYAGEKPLLSITAQNYTKYADRLDNLAEMFKRFPNYRMDIYPSHRNFIYPQWLLENTAKNATSCKGTDNELKLQDCYAGMPFPIAKTGSQVMWNHLTQFEQRSYGGMVNSYVVPMSGPAVLQVSSNLTQSSPFYDPDSKSPQPSNAAYWRARTQDQAPPRQAGGSVLVVDSLDTIRRAWQYIPGQRRVKLAPDLSYDTPSPYSGGAATMDDQKGFSGALDRYDFKLTGKKEKFIPYNNYELADYKTCPVEKVVATKNFPNPDCIRWELHRVWMVEATLKAGYRHIYKKRIFFWDEDAPGIGIVENYDAAGKLYRLTLNGGYPLYSAPEGHGGNASLFWNLDLQTGIYGFSALGNCDGPQCGLAPLPIKPDSFYSPEAIAGEGVR